MNQFRQYVVTKLGREAWSEFTRELGVSEDQFRLSETYPDEHLLALVQSASRRTDLPVAMLLEDFGVYIAPALLRVYAPLIMPHWRTLDVIAHTEQAIHTAVRSRMEGAAPPALMTRRISSGQVELDYHSERRLCAVAKGIARGLADHFGETLRTSEQECMLRGDRRCLLLFEVGPDRSEVAGEPVG